jgi:hypothetical protein
MYQLFNLYGYKWRNNLKNRIRINSLQIHKTEHITPVQVYTDTPRKRPVTERPVTKRPVKKRPVTNVQLQTSSYKTSSYWTVQLQNVQLCPPDLRCRPVMSAWQMDAFVCLALLPLPVREGGGRRLGGPRLTLTHALGNRDITWVGCSSNLSIKEYWMIYWFGSSPLAPLFPSVTSPSRSPVSKLYGRYTGRQRKRDSLLTGEGKRGGRGSELYNRKKTGPLYHKHDTSKIKINACRYQYSLTSFHYTGHMA